MAGARGHKSTVSLSKIRNKRRNYVRIFLEGLVSVPDSTLLEVLKLLGRLILFSFCIRLCNGGSKVFDEPATVGAETPHWLVWATP